MANTPQNKPVKPAAAAAPTYKSPLASRKKPDSAEPRGNQTFLFDRQNYIWMAAGLICILIGFALMSGGKSPDPHQFNYSEVYSFRRITLAPIVIMIGFGIEAYAIMLKHPGKQLRP